MWRWLGWACLGLMVLAMGLAGYVRSLLWFPPDQLDVAVTCPADTPPVPTDSELSVLVWNVQFAASRKHHFFYDGGQAVHVPAADVTATLDEMARVVRELDPDVILWQEFDRDSDRTDNVDQLQEMLQRTPYPCYASTPYHKVGYVPTPGHEHMGKVDFHLAVFSKYRLTSATRHQLALMDEPAWRQWFNLRRALFDVRALMDNGKELALLDTHLSAFSNNDGTLFEQVGQIDRHLTALEKSGVAWVLGGDFNALPPGDDPNRLGADVAASYGPETPMAKMYDRYTPIWAERTLRDAPDVVQTYLPYGAIEPDRTIDYGFVGREVTLRGAEVLQERDISDHLPFVIRMSLGPLAAEAAAEMPEVVPDADVEEMEAP
ncbi:MAG: endonuclease/exonuclease/phosphatase family protein [Myxococcota bacterium]